MVFVPFNGAKAGTPVEFAGGFAGPEASARNVKTAAYRPVGVAVGPDGALYVADSNKGKIWRISYGNRQQNPGLRGFASALTVAEGGGNP